MMNVSLATPTRSETLSGTLALYLYAALIVAGPWIFTVLGLSVLGADSCNGPCADLTIFRSIIIYNSMYAFIVASPLAFFSGRYVSQQLHGGSDQHVFYVFTLCLGIFLLATLAIAVPFYLLATTLEPYEKIAAIQNIVLIGSAWLLIPFLGAFRAHNSILLAYGLGFLAMLLAGRFFPNATVTSLLVSFGIGFAITNLVLLGTLVRNFGTAIVVDQQLPREWRKSWELPAAGLGYALGLWIDKIIMWWFAPADGLTVAGALDTMPSYDTAMFWSQLASIPVIAVFFVEVESRSSGLLKHFHRRLQEHASLSEIKELVGKITKNSLSSIVSLFGGFMIIAALMILISLAFMPQLGLRPTYMSILRVALCAMAFYASAMLCFNFLLFLDLRRPALLIVSTFLVLNATLTAALLPLGPSFYGYGNLIASAVSLLVGFVLLLKELPWLHYHAFVTNNFSR